MNEQLIKLIIVALAVFFMNVPFGFLRAREIKFSFRWFLFIHLPVPIVIMLRIFSHLGFAPYTYPILIVSFFLGQFLGRKKYEKVLSQI